MARMEIAEGAWVRWIPDGTGRVWWRGFLHGEPTGPWQLADSVKDIRVRLYEGRVAAYRVA